MNAAIDHAESTEVKPWKKYIRSDGSLTIQNAVEKFMISRMNCTPKTTQVYRAALNLLVKFMTYHKSYNLTDIDADLLEYFFACLLTPIDKDKLASGELNYRKWMDEKNQGKEYKPNYVHNLYRPVNTMVRYYQRRDALPLFIYVHPVPDNKSSLWSPSAEEFDRALNACLNDRDFIIICFMGDSALRAEETVSVDWEHINFEEEKVRVNNAKWNTVREVSLSKELLSLLKRHHDSLPESLTQKGEPVFRSSSGTRLTKSGLQSMIARLKDRTGVDFSAHDLRRFAMRIWKKAGRTLEDTQTAGGHVDPQTTRHYLGRIEPGVTPGQRATNALNFLINQGKLPIILERLGDTPDGLEIR